MLLVQAATLHFIYLFISKQLLKQVQRKIKMYKLSVKALMKTTHKVNKNVPHKTMPRVHKLHFNKSSNILSSRKEVRAESGRTLLGSPELSPPLELGGWIITCLAPAGT